MAPSVAADVANAAVNEGALKLFVHYSDLKFLLLANPGWTVRKLRWEVLRHVHELFPGSVEPLPFFRVQQHPGGFYVPETLRVRDAFTNNGVVKCCPGVCCVGAGVNTNNVADRRAGTASGETTGAIIGGTATSMPGTGSSAAEEQEAGDGAATKAVGEQFDCQVAVLHSYLDYVAQRGGLLDDREWWRSTFSSPATSGPTASSNANNTKKIGLLLGLLHCSALVDLRIQIAILERVLDDCENYELLLANGLTFVLMKLLFQSCSSSTRVPQAQPSSSSSSSLALPREDEDDEDVRLKCRRLQLALQILLKLSDEPTAAPYWESMLLDPAKIFWDAHDYYRQNKQFFDADYGLQVYDRLKTRNLLKDNPALRMLKPAGVPGGAVSERRTGASQQSPALAARWYSSPPGKVASPDFGGLKTGSPPASSPPTNSPPGGPQNFGEVTFGKDDFDPRMRDGFAEPSSPAERLPSGVPLLGTTSCVEADAGRGVVAPADHEVEQVALRLNVVGAECEQASELLSARIRDRDFSFENLQADVTFLLSTLVSTTTQIQSRPDASSSRQKEKDDEHELMVRRRSQEILLLERILAYPVGTLLRLNHRLWDLMFADPSTFNVVAPFLEQLALSPGHDSGVERAELKKQLVTSLAAYLRWQFRTTDNVLFLKQMAFLNSAEKTREFPYLQELLYCVFLGFHDRFLLLLNSVYGFFFAKPLLCAFRDVVGQGAAGASEEGRRLLEHEDCAEVVQTVLRRIRLEPHFLELLLDVLADLTRKDLFRQYLTQSTSVFPFLIAALEAKSVFAGHVLSIYDLGDGGVGKHVGPFLDVGGNTGGRGEGEGNGQEKTESALLEKTVNVQRRICKCLAHLAADRETRNLCRKNKVLKHFLRKTRDVTVLTYLGMVLEAPEAVPD
eukprot:CAMPEP_0178983338 /NCGR_PEP_ID=MMETSP0795-20121207/1004_1 /TAXON_ID=88552 /ORGANISM="Amoebophrya sp., Strain Ameob2" /LENGTH=904 /DNA_ID=CAMNT_0020674099 /DNA_START=32 /DNA_END=2746 /DNA_ORIENTATION=-